MCLPPAYLPPPAPDRSGWPWTRPAGTTGADEGTVPVQNWPKLSIITPSYNYGQYLEAAIRSVLLQGYPNLEYIIIDGGSQDGSREIIEKYAGFLSYWVSEPDRGQTHAISKGVEMAGGDLVTWLNADDLYLPGALARVGTAWLMQPGSMVAGPVINFYGEDYRQEVERVSQAGLLGGLVRFWAPGSEYHQPGIFVPRDAWHAVGGLDESLYFVMDQDLLSRLILTTPAQLLDEPLAAFRLHGLSKTATANLIRIRERSMVSKRYWSIYGVADRHAHDRFVSAKLALLSGQCARRADFRRAAGIFATALRMGLAPQTVLSLSAQTCAWLWNRVTGNPD